MKKLFTICFSLLVGISMSSCSIDDLHDFLKDKPDSPLLQRNFEASMNSSQEVAPTPVVSNATGQTVFQLSEDGKSLSYKLWVDKVENVTMAHIHLAPVGVNGPVVAWLYPPGPPPQPKPGVFSGLLAEGVITQANLVGPLEGMTLDDLLKEMRAARTYVNVHSVQYPAGVIRGQIK